MATTVAVQAVVDESKVQELVGLLKKSVAAFGERDDVEHRLYSYMRYIERIFNKMPKEEAIAAEIAAWDFAESCDANEVVSFVKSHNPRLPGKVCAELARRTLASNLARAKALPTYDDVVEFLNLEWAFDRDRFPGGCADPIDEDFYRSISRNDEDAPVIGGYEDPFFEVDMSIGLGRATAEEARKLIALAQTVNAARAEYRRGKQQVAGKVGARNLKRSNLVQFPARTAVPT